MISSPRVPRLVLNLALVASACGAISASACGTDEQTPGFRGPCAEPGGPFGECPLTSVTSADEACWRLVECGVIPVANPEEQPDCCFDWARCVDFVEELPEAQFELTLACVESNTCEALRARGSPDRTQDLPPCLDQGDP